MDNTFVKKSLAKILLIAICLNFFLPILNTSAKYDSSNLYITNNIINTATGTSNFTVPYWTWVDENIISINNLTFSLELDKTYSWAVLFLDYCNWDCSEWPTATWELLYTWWLLDFSNSYFSWTVDGTSTGFLVNYENLIDWEYWIWIIPWTWSTVDEYMTGAIWDKAIDYDFIVDTKPQILSFTWVEELTYTWTSYQVDLDLENTWTWDILFYDFGIWWDETYSHTWEVILDWTFSTYPLNLDFWDKFESYTWTWLQLHVDIRNSDNERTKINNNWEKNVDIVFIKQPEDIAEFLVNEYVDTTSTWFLLVPDENYSVYDCWTDESCDNYTWSLVISNNDYNDVLDWRVAENIYWPSWLSVESWTDTWSVDTTASWNIDYTSTWNILLFVDQDWYWYKYEVTWINTNWQDNWEINNFVVDTFLWEEKNIAEIVSATWSNIVNYDDTSYTINYELSWSINDWDYILAKISNWTDSLINSWALVDGELTWSLDINLWTVFESYTWTNLYVSLNIIDQDYNLIDNIDYNVDFIEKTYNSWAVNVWECNNEWLWEWIYGCIWEEPIESFSWMINYNAPELHLDSAVAMTDTSEFIDLWNVSTGSWVQFITIWTWAYLNTDCPIENDLIWLEDSFSWTCDIEFSWTNEIYRISYDDKFLSSEIEIAPELVSATWANLINYDDTSYTINYELSWATIKTGDFITVDIENDGLVSTWMLDLTEWESTGSLNINLWTTFKSYTWSNLNIHLELYSSWKIYHQDQFDDLREYVVDFNKNTYDSNASIKLKWVLKPQNSNCEHYGTYIKSPFSQYTPFDLSGSILPEWVSVWNNGGLEFEDWAYYKVYLNNEEIYSWTDITNDCNWIVTPNFDTWKFDWINSGSWMTFSIWIIDKNSNEYLSNEFSYTADADKPEIEAYYLNNEDDSFSLTATGSDNYGINQYYWFVEYDDLSTEINDYNIIPTWDEHFLWTWSSINVSNTWTYAIVVDDVVWNITYKAFEVKEEDKLVSADPDVDLTNTEKAVTTQDVEFSTGSIKVILPSGLEITKDWTWTFDATSIAVNSISNVEWLSDDEIEKGALEFWLGSGTWILFSIPVKIEIPVPWIADWEIYIKAKHWWTTYFTTRWLTNNPNAECINWDSNSHSDKAIVSNWIATIYTCSASDFVAYDKKVTSTTTVVRHSGWGGWWWSYLPTCIEEVLVCKKSWDTFKWFRQKWIRCKAWNLWKACSLKENNIEKVILKIEKYKPKNKKITNFAIKLDKILSKKGKSNDSNLLKIRNNILEKIDYLVLNKNSLSKKEKSKLIKEIKIIIKDFKTSVENKKIINKEKYKPKNKKIVNLSNKLDKILSKKGKSNNSNLLKIRNNILEKIDYLVLNKSSLSKKEKLKLIKEIKIIIKDFKISLKN